jgi:hypothetical protein
MLGALQYGSGYPQQGGIGFNPYASVPAPLARSWLAGAAGVALNRFAWGDPASGLVANVYEPATLFGLAIPQPYRVARNGWNLAYWNQRALILRQGMGLVLAAIGDFWVRFPGGAIVGSQVFAAMADGTPWVMQPVLDSNGQIVLDSHGQPVLSSQAPGGAFATPWTAMTCAQPGGAALISSFSKPF